MQQPPTKTSDRSPQDVDPLSWFTGPLVPLVFASLTAFYGIFLAFATWRHSTSVLLQIVAAVLCASGSVLIHFATRPKRPPIGWVLSSAALLIALCGYLLSAWDYAGGGLFIEQWWGPGGVALTIASLSPYLPIRRLVVLGLVTTVVAGGIGTLNFPPSHGAWSYLGLIFLLVTPPLVAVVASSVFIVTVVRTTERLLAERVEDTEEDRAIQDAASAVEQGTLARLTVRTAPFLERLAESGIVTATDRAVAGQLARRLRDDLVFHTSATWLDAIAAERRLVVVDPERRADAMNDAQKTALTALIDAILNTPDTGSNSVLVELRGEENGATAVGVSMDLQLPEGRRTMHLAPYYLTLKTAFEGLSWNDGRLLKMRFEVPAQD